MIARVGQGLLCVAAMATGVALISGRPIQASSPALPACPVASGIPTDSHIPLSNYLPPLRPQPTGVPWPTRDWPRGPITPDRRAALDRMVNDPANQVRALLVVQGGRIVYERYKAPFNKDTAADVESTGKMVNNALVGVLVRDGRLDVTAPAPIPAWRADPDDPRSRIRLRDLMEMRTGQINPLFFGADDRGVSPYLPIADFAAASALMPLAFAPGTHFSYSSDSSYIISDLVHRRVGGGAAEMQRFFNHEVAVPLGMTSSTHLRLLPGGTYDGSAALLLPARDLARFGYLYLRGGVWDGRRILPMGWVDYTRTLASIETLGHPEYDGGAMIYGAHSMQYTNPAAPRIAPGMTFGHAGWRGQGVWISPAHDLVVVQMSELPIGGAKGDSGSLVPLIVDLFPYVAAGPVLMGQDCHRAYRPLTIAALKPYQPAVASALPPEAAIYRSAGYRQFAAQYMSWKACSCAYVQKLGDKFDCEQRARTFATESKGLAPYISTMRFSFDDVRHRAVVRSADGLQYGRSEVKVEGRSCALEPTSLQ